MGRKKKQLPSRNAYLLDCYFHDLLKKGRPLVNPSTGEPLLDEQGQQLYGPLTAADLNAIRGRLKDCGVQETEETDPVAAAMAAIDRGQRADHDDKPDTYTFPSAADA